MGVAQTGPGCGGRRTGSKSRKRLQLELISERSVIVLIQLPGGVVVLGLLQCREGFVSPRLILDDRDRDRV